MQKKTSESRRDAERGFAESNSYFQIQNLASLTIRRHDFNVFALKTSREEI